MTGVPANTRTPAAASTTALFMSAVNSEVESMSEPQRSPLASLVLFMFCLSIAGSALAGAHYYAVDLPAQKNVQAPENAQSSMSKCNTCKKNCIVDPDIYKCLSECELHCSG